MKAFQSLLVLMTLAIAVYTGIVVANYGPNLIPTIVEGVSSLTWQGQFHLDFSFYLILSALWLAWRHNFSSNGIILALLASVLGILFFAPYLLIISSQSKGDTKVMLIGEQRASV